MNFRTLLIDLEEKNGDVQSIRNELRSIQNFSSRAMTTAYSPGSCNDVTAKLLERREAKRQALKTTLQERELIVAELTQIINSANLSPQEKQIARARYILGLRGFALVERIYGTEADFQSSYEKYKRRIYRQIEKIERIIF